jgi:hypothetical protein
LQNIDLHCVKTFKQDISNLSWLLQTHELLPITSSHFNKKVAVRSPPQTNRTTSLYTLALHLSRRPLNIFLPLIRVRGVEIPGRDLTHPLPGLQS